MKNQQYRQSFLIEDNAGADMKPRTVDNLNLVN